MDEKEGWYETESSWFELLEATRANYRGLTERVVQQE